MANEITTDIRLDLDKFKSGLKSAEKAGKRSGKVTGQAFGNRFEQVSARAIGGLRRKILGLGAAIAGALTFRASISAAIQQEDALNRMNTQLALSGDFSAQASRSMREFASQLQRTSIFGDEVTLDMIALAKTFGTTNDRARDLVRAATELSAATGMELTSAVRNLGKSLSGMMGELGESLPMIRTLTAEQLKAGGAIDLVIERFSGSAKAATMTFSGALKQATNSFSDLLEGFGAAITQSPIVIAAVNRLSGSFNEFGKSVSTFVQSGAIERMVQSIVAFGSAIVTYIVAPVELAVNAIELAFNGIATVVNLTIESIISKFAGLSLAIGKLVPKFEEVGLELARISQTMRDTTAQLAADTSRSFDELFQFDATARAEEFMMSFQEFIDNVGPRMENLMRQTAVRANEAQLQEYRKGWEMIVSGFNSAFSQAALTSEEFAKQLARTTQQAFVNFRNQLVQSISVIGSALVKGENIFSAFGKAILGVFGDLAIQLGSFYLLLGLGNLFVNPAAAAGQIAAGTGLLILGGALKALAGGAGGTTSAAAPAAAPGGGVAAGGGMGEAPVDTTTEFTEEQRDVQPATEVTVNIQGNVLDRRQTGIELAEVLSETFGSNGVVLARV